jgi:hypothetical protein
MIFRAAADLVVGVHAAFVIFVVLGGLIVVRWPRFAWVHVPAAVWGVLIEFADWICPLTPLENYLGHVIRVRRPGSVHSARRRTLRRWL